MVINTIKLDERSFPKSIIDYKWLFVIDNVFKYNNNDNNNYMKSSDAEASKCRLKFLLKWAFLSGSYVYVQLFHFNSN